MTSQDHKQHNHDLTEPSITHIFPFNCVEDDSEFKNCIDNLNLSNKISLMDLQNRLFNPFELSVDCDKYLTDIDPDKNYFKDTLGNQ